MVTRPESTGCSIDMLEAITTLLDYFNQTTLLVHIRSGDATLPEQCM